MILAGVRRYLCQDNNTVKVHQFCIIFQYQKTYLGVILVIYYNSKCFTSTIQPKSSQRTCGSHGNHVLLIFFFFFNFSGINMRLVGREYWNRFSSWDAPICNFQNEQLHQPRNGFHLSLNRKVRGKKIKVMKTEDTG